MTAIKLNYNYSASERFLKYVTIDTQSDFNSNSIPSSLKQKNLSALLVEELKSIGLTNVEMDKYGYVYATLPSNIDVDVPKICLCAHVDTSPDCSGENVKPIIHHNYQGLDIILPDDNTQVIKLSEHTELSKQIGNDIITASGKTLLGADNKAGVAAIVDAMAFLCSNPDVKHGDVKVLFTVDEEIGRGADNVDLKRLDADYAYTIDGESVGLLEDETFSADAFSVFIEGVSTHPGYAKDKMINAIKIAAEILSELPKDSISPETTHKKEGFIHPTDIKGSVENAEIHFIIRDHITENLFAFEDKLKDIIQNIMSKYPKAKHSIKISQQYRNMKLILDKHPYVINNALEGIKRSGITPSLHSIRGGTDGSRFSFMGLPCPNIYTGGHAFHSKHEWISIQDLNKTVETIVNILNVWTEKK